MDGEREGEAHHADNSEHQALAGLRLWLGRAADLQVGEPANGGYKEYYIRDASGNIMATYKYTNSSSASLKLTERPIYGSSRIGSHTQEMEMVGSTPPQYYPYTQPMPAPKKRYELTDHLGNVTTVLTGRLLPDNSGTSAYQGEVLSAQGYEPFGMELPGRHWQSDVSRFGFQGQLKDREISAVPFKYRMYSPDGSGFWSVDPLAKDYPWNSPYAFAENKVIQFIELEGLEAAESAAKSGSTNTDNLPTLSDVLTQGSEINQNTLLPSVTIKRELPARIEPLPVADNSDNLGYFRSPSAAERETNPVGSLLKDISLPIINMSGVGAVDDWFGVVNDANSTSGDVANATLGLLLTTRSARRQSMRNQGVPTSRSSVEQRGNGANRQYVVQGSDESPQIITRHSSDANHPNPHWHTAPAKMDDAGRIRTGNYGEYKYQTGGSAVEYQEP